VVRYRGRFYMVYSCEGRDREAGFRLCLAASDRPEGPFTDVHAPWLDTGWSCIDADLFVDEDGTPYLSFDKVGVVREPERYMYGMIYAVRLSDDLSRATTQPVLCAQSDQPWEEMDPKLRSRCNEGAFVFKHKGVYYMTYSSGHYLSPRYGIGWATARSPLGPWTKSGENPLLASDASQGVSGPGHSCMTWSPDGKEMFIVYHAHADASRPGAGRTVNIDRVAVDAQGNLRVRGPTRTPQTRPSIATP
jgi:beta-xylosidase